MGHWIGSPRASPSQSGRPCRGLCSIDANLLGPDRLGLAGIRTYRAVSEMTARYRVMLVAIDQITSVRMPGRKP